MKLFQDLPSVSLADRAYLPPVAGVYIAATDIQLLYVGQSANMRDRWKGHHKLDRLMTFPGVRLYYLLVPEGFCGQLESALIRQLAPLLNGGNDELLLSDRPSLATFQRSKAKPWSYGDRAVQINAKLSEEARAGLREEASKYGISLNEYLERLGRGLPLSRP